MKVSLTGVTSLVMEYARTLVVGVVFQHLFAGVGSLGRHCFVTSRGLGLLAKTYLSSVFCTPARCFVTAGG
jgi:hypothetical protein